MFTIRIKRLIFKWRSDGKYTHLEIHTWNKNLNRLEILRWERSCLLIGILIAQMADLAVAYEKGDDWPILLMHLTLMERKDCLLMALVVLQFIPNYFWDLLARIFIKPSKDSVNLWDMSWINAIVYLILNYELLLGLEC